MLNKTKQVIFLTVLSLSLPFALFATEGSSISKGTFDNGLTYFIHDNPEEKKHISLRLLIKAGSALERESERGLAHFVEHMVFKGSDNFAPGEVISELESLGAAFGREVNAYTSFEHTEYRIDLPLKKSKFIKKALLILSDWAFRTHISDIEVEKERDVILDEKRRRNSPAHRAAAFNWSQLTVGSQYEERHPIGTESVIKFASPEKIRSFYKRWYTPQNMAVLISGDVQGKLSKNTLREYFGKTPSSGSERLPHYEISKSSQTRFAVNIDQESVGSLVSVTYKRILSEKTEKRESARKLILDELLQTMMSERFFSLSQKIDTPFLSVRSNLRQPLSLLSNNKYSVKSSEEDTFSAIDSLLTELKRAESHGFSIKELSRAKAHIQLQGELALNEPGKFELRLMKEHFLRENTYVQVENFIQARSNILSTIDLSEINLWAISALSNQNRLIHVSTSMEDFTTDFLKGLLLRVEETPLGEYVDEESEGELSPSAAKAGKILGTREYLAVNMTELTLENGMKVLIKPSQLEKGEILITAHARGGLSQLGQSDLASGKLANSLSTLAGIGKLSPVQVKKLLSGKHVDIKTSISAYSRSIKGVTRKEDFATSLQLLHTLFTSSRDNRDAYELTIKRNRHHTKRKALDPIASFYGRAKSFNSQNHFYYEDLSEKSLRESRFEKTDNFLRNSFTNPADFTIFIVGDFESEKAVSLIETYLASIPTKENSKSRLKGLRMAFPEGVVQKTVSSSISNTGLTQINIPVSITKGRFKGHRLQSVVQVLKTRLMQKLRREMGATYHVKVKCHNPLFSRTQNIITITFSSDPADRQSLIYATFLELYRLKTEGITQEEVKTVRTLQELRFNNRLSTNEFWMSSLFKRYRLGLSPEGIFGADVVIKSLSVEDMEVIIDQIFPLKNYNVLFSKPLKQSSSQKVFTGIATY
jgi:zinc protease